MPSRDNNSYDAVKNIHTTNSRNASETIQSETNNDTTTTNMSRLFECRNGNNKIRFQRNEYEFDELFIDLSKKLEFYEKQFYFMYGACDIKHNNEYYILFNFQQMHCINGQEKRLKLLLRRIDLEFNQYNEFRSKLINMSSVVLYIFGTVSPATDRYNNSFISINVKLLNHLHFVSPWPITSRYVTESGRRFHIAPPRQERPSPSQEITSS